MAHIRSRSVTGTRRGRSPAADGGGDGERRSRSRPRNLSPESPTRYRHYGLGLDTPGPSAPSLGPSPSGPSTSAFSITSPHASASYTLRRRPPVHELAASLPSTSHFPRSESATHVPAESDFLADWETLARLVAPTPSPAPPPSPALTAPTPSSPFFSPRPRPGSVRSSRCVTSPVRIRRHPIADVPEDLESEAEAEASAISYTSELSGSPDALSPPRRDPSPAASDATVTMARTPGIEESYQRFFAPPTPTPPPHSENNTPGTRLNKADTPILKSAPSRWAAVRSWRLPPWWRPIFKCALAYFLASLFTFVPALSGLLSSKTETDVHGRVRRVPAYSAHMVATIVVYFNPSKTLGNMILSTRYCFTLALLAALVCLLSFEIIKLFDYYSPTKGEAWDWVSEAGDWIVCIFCVGGSMGGLAWLKLWVDNPSFNTGCSMAAVTLFTVVVKEGGWPKLKEVLIIVLIGATITNVVCFTILPVSATSRLQVSMTKSLNSFSTLLDLLTSTFLLQPPLERDHRMPLADAVKSHGAAFSSLKADLSEAQHERLVDPRIRGSNFDLYTAALGSMARLAQHLAALRGSTRFEESILLAVREGRISLDPAEKSNPNIAASVVGDLNTLPTVRVEDQEDVADSIDLLLQLQRMTGANLDLLVERCDDALDGIEAVLAAAGKPATVGSEDEYLAACKRVRDGVSDALDNFSRSSSRAIKRIYAGPRRRTGVYGSDESSSESGSESEDDEGPNEVVFLVYFSLFTIEEFARELLFLIDTVYDITAAPPLSAMDQVSYFVRPWRGRRRRNFLYKQFQKLVPVDPSRLQPPLFPRTQRDERGTLLTPGRAGLSLRRRIYQWAWELGARLSEPDMKHAFKTGAAGAMLAAPAFIDRARPVFLEYKGEWALIAFFATMSQSIGQTNFLSVYRILGTLLGAAAAVLACTLFPEDPVMLPIFGFLFSLPCFYIITQTNYVQAGRFILLTYNLTCLYAYNLRAVDLSPITIATRRSTSVIVGVTWAGIVSRYWWPYTARRELRMGLGDFCLDLSYLYSKLVTTYTRGVPPRPDLVVTEYPADHSPSDERTPLLPTTAPLPRHHLAPDVLQFMAMELHLQGQLATLRGLLTHAKREPRLKGPFASDFYHQVLLSCERMLDRLHSMRCVTTRHEWDESTRQAFILPVNALQREMAGTVILYFYTLSAGFRLRIPMPPYLPPAERARERLVTAIRDLDVVRRRSVRAGGRHLLFFAYALAMHEVIAELDFVGALLQDAFGVISQSTAKDFEQLFDCDAEAQVHSAHFNDGGPV